MEIQQLESLLYELKNIYDKAHFYIKGNNYVYTDVFHTWVERYNDCIVRYNKMMNMYRQPFIIDEWDYSSSGKTIKNSAVDFFIATLSDWIKDFEIKINDLKNEELQKKTPHNQIRSCFKLNIDICPVDPKLERNKIFVGMPFSDEYLDSFNYGIKLAIEYCGFKYFKADEVISNIDIMCKICRELQSCGLAIFNISDLNPNVMLELGLAYGMGKPVIIVKDSKTKIITDIGGIEYIEYTHAHDLQQKLIKALLNIR